MGTYTYHSFFFHFIRKTAILYFMKIFVPEKYWHKFFEIGVFVKGFNGIWETLSGLLVLFLNKETIRDWFFVLASRELLEDPSDHLINFLAGVLQNFSREAQTFAALYILIHGALNIFLAVQLYRGKKWAYLFVINVTTLFVLYQIYRIGIHHSLLLTILTIIDILFVVVAWHEYRHLYPRGEQSK